MRTAYTAAASATQRHANGARNGVASATAWAAKKGSDARQSGRSRSRERAWRLDLRAARHGRVIADRRRSRGGCRARGEGPPFSEGGGRGGGAPAARGHSMLVATEDGRDVHRESFIRLMAETLPLAGYGGVRADLPGWDQPEVIHGAMRDHRPSLFCDAPKPTFLDVLSPGPVTLEDVASRWQLFASAAELTGGEFHVVIPRWVAGRDGRHVAKQIAELVGVRIGYIWTV